ncbi:MAG: divalent-cation tolerance protein CutA [Chloroflexi bacterium]|nr:divalent-cation tolerance protein CutA [Chloroflexota bacterium]
MTDAIQVVTTVERREDAERLVQAIINQRLAACAQILGPMQSTYWWQGKVETATEYLIIFKSRTEIYPALEAAIKAAHPYQVPEILAVPVVAGNPDYLAWLRAETRAAGPKVL